MMASPDKLATTSLPPASARLYVADAHTPFEDAYGMASGVAFAAVGIVLLKAAGLVTSGAAGMALLLAYAVKLPVGLLFMLINFPFFLFGYFFMGLRFTVKSLIGSVLIMAMLQLMPDVLTITYVHPALAALFGGTLCGMGVLAFARHGAALGGTGIVTLWLHKRYHINAGRSQLAIDSMIALVSLTMISPTLVAWSAVSGFAISSMLIVWHRPERG
jgi:uncharacterized membrane-anchored protein YitT (DUF2179 family)